MIKTPEEKLGEETQDAFCQLIAAINTADIVTTKMALGLAALHFATALLRECHVDPGAICRAVSVIYERSANISAPTQEEPS